MMDENPYKSSGSQQAKPENYGTRKKNSHAPIERSLFDLPVMVGAAVLVGGVVMVLGEFVGYHEYVSFGRIALGLGMTIAAYLFLCFRW